MTKISRDEVKKLAQLARISITDEEAEKFQNELSGILGFVDSLNDIDTSGVEPTSQVTGLENVNRDDTERSYGVTPEELLKTAPDSKNGYVKVKRVLG